MRSYSNYHRVRSIYPRYTSIQQRNQADFVFNPVGLIAKVASVAPATRDALRARQLLKAKGSSLPKQIRGSLQKGFGTYVEGIHTASLSGAGARSLYKGGRSAMRSAKRSAPGVGVKQKIKTATGQGLRKGGKSLRQSATGATLDRIRNPISDALPGVSDAAKVYKSVRPRGYKLPGARTRAGSRVLAGVNRGGAVLGIG